MSEQITIKNEADITMLKKSGHILGVILAELENAIKPGITGSSLDKIASQRLNKLGAEPAFKGYGGFPASLCVSINDAIVHGLPGDQIINDGDIVGIDFGVRYKGYYTDAARTIIAGKANPVHKRFVDTTQKSLDIGLSVIKPGAFIGDIGSAVQGLLESQGYGVIRDLVGHGVGFKVHEPPQIPNYGKAGTGPKLLPGMVLAIEPMAAMGSYSVYKAADGWAIMSKDGSMTAHFEDTIVVTQDGYINLTRI